MDARLSTLQAPGMQKLLVLVVGALLAGSPVSATAADDSAELTTLLREFLAGASRNDPAVHERFWADDLVYTSARGVRKSKAEILRDVKSSDATKSTAPSPVYTAEEIRIRQYGEAATVAFKLVATTEQSSGSNEVAEYFNTGTFVKRDGKWQVVAWQATAIPKEAAE